MFGQSNLGLRTRFFNSDGAMAKAMSIGLLNLSKRLKSPLVIAAVAALASSGGISVFAASNGWVDTFNLDECDLAPNGSNSYFFLEPGYKLILQGQDDGDRLELVVTVLNETRSVNGTETRIVEERESENGELVEVSRNYMAICLQTGDIYYFGEVVDLYDNGKVEAHEGEWLAGENGAHAGLIMPAKPVVGFKHYQEFAPGVAEDRAEIISLNETLKVPAGVYTNVLKVEETTPLEPREIEYKYYAPGIGLLQDEDVKLIDYFIPKPMPKPLTEMKPQPQQVSANNATVVVPMNSSGTIGDFTVDEKNKNISFKVDAGKGVDGATIIGVGRILDGPYVVTMDGQVTSDYAVVSSDLTIMRINHTNAQHQFVISGTSVVPEFNMLPIWIAFASTCVLLVLNVTRASGLFR